MGIFYLPSIKKDESKFRFRLLWDGYAPSRANVSRHRRLP